MFQSLKLTHRLVFASCFMNRETSSIKVNDIASQIADNVGAAVDAANGLPAGDRILTFHYNRRSPKRRRLIAPISINSSASAISDISSSSKGDKKIDSTGISSEEKKKDENSASTNVPSDSDEGLASLSKMVAVLCEQQLFLPLLRAFEMFLPSCPLLPFIRALQVCGLNEIHLFLGWLYCFLYGVVAKCCQNDFMYFRSCIC